MVEPSKYILLESVSYKKEKHWTAKIGQACTCSVAILVLAEGEKGRQFFKNIVVLLKNSLFWAHVSSVTGRSITK